MYISSVREFAGVEGALKADARNGSVRYAAAPVRRERTPSSSRSENALVFSEQAPAVRGMVKKVIHLVDVEEID
jgi:hypothetical protein